MPDIAKCANKSCKFRKECYRYRARPKIINQDYGEFKPGRDGKCDFMIPVNNRKDILPFNE